MRLVKNSVTRNIYSALNESNPFEDMIWDRISEYADPEEYFLDKLTDEDVEAIANDLKDIWQSGSFEQSDLDDVMEKYAYQKYGNKNESLKEGKYVLKYWGTEEDRDEGYSETEYIEADDKESAIAKVRELYYDNDWASCELGNADDEDVVNPIFGMYPGEKEVEEERFEESVTVSAGSTYVTVDETGVTVEDGGTNITVDAAASINIENNEIVDEEPIAGEEIPTEEVADEELPVDGEEAGEDIIEPSEELVASEEDLEENLQENAGDPNNTVEIYKNPECDYSIKDVTELDNVDLGDVRSIDMFSILNDLEESLVERFGTEYYGLINPFLTRQGRHKKTNESYASAILDVSIPKTKKLQELNTVLTVEVYGDKALKECVVKDARYNKRIERFCGKTKNPVKFLENVVVDLINNRAKVNVTKYQPMTEDTKVLKEEVSDEAYEIADLIDKHCGDRVQYNDYGKILRRDDFDEEFYTALRKVYNLPDLESVWDNGVLPNGEDVWDLENTVRGILSFSGWETIYENEDETDFCEGDLVVRGETAVNEDVELLVNKPEVGDGINFANGKAIEKDVKRQEKHIKHHKALGKTVKKFEVEKEPDQKNTSGKEAEELTDTVDTKGDGKKKSPSKKKKVAESVNEEADRIMLEPVKNFDYVDPYGVYYKDGNGKLYKAEDNGNQLFICTKNGENLEQVDPDKYILGDQALNEVVAEDKYTLAKCKKAIEEIDSKDGFYDKVRDIIGYNDKEWNEWYGWEDGEIKELQRVADMRYEELQGDLKEAVKIFKEAEGLLDDEDTPTESDVEDSESTDGELEEGTTDVAIFHRKPASVDAMRQAEANGITVNKSNYRIIGKKELSDSEFEDFSKHLSSKNYQWLKDMYKADDSNSGVFNCIEVSNSGDSSTTLLVDPNGYDYARYCAFKSDLEETPDEAKDEEVLEDPEEI